MNFYYKDWDISYALGGYELRDLSNNIISSIYKDHNAIYYCYINSEYNNYYTKNLEDIKKFVETKLRLLGYEKLPDKLNNFL